MNDVERLILEAWQKLGPKIMADPHELAKRLARRRLAILTRPVRAWCLAVRASDTRITPAHWVIVPEHAMDLNHPAHPYEPIEHEVIIRPHALRKFCRAVRTDSWGEEVADVCKALGTTRATLLSSRWAARFSERYVKGLGGKHGRPIPLIHSWTTLDPSGSYFFSRPDQLWGSLWEFLPDMIPDDFEQTIIRRPFYSPFPTKGAPKEYWERRFRGWRWLCPSCKKPTRIIYYPIAPQTVFDFLGYDPGRIGTLACHPYCRPQSKKFLPHDVHDIPAPPPTFACQKCHRIHPFSRVPGQGAWNLLVTTLTRGLLFGHEVPKPAWYQDQRKRARHRSLHRRAPRREAVLRRLLNGWSERQIARDLMMSLPMVQIHRRHLCRQERVANRTELAKKLGSPHPQPLNMYENARQRRQRIQQLLLDGLTYRQIAKREGMSKQEVAVDAVAIYRKAGLAPGQGIKALASKLGVTLGGRHGLNPQILSRLLAGESNEQIMQALNLTRSALICRMTKILRGEGVKGRKGLFEKFARSQKSRNGSGMLNAEMKG